MVGIDKKKIDMRRVVKVWWPLAASWLLMSAEGPALSAVIARLANPEINLAAFGGIVFPIALIIEAPVIMLLSASTALSKDYASFLKVRRIMMIMGASLTALHILLAFTPLYEFVVSTIIGVPDEIVAPGRAGLQLLVPWTWAIAYRRFHQGVLIRFGHSDGVGVGTVVRLAATGSVLVTGYLIGDIPGVMVGAAAQAFGVTSEAIFVGLRTRPVIQRELRLAPAVESLTISAFASFYIPLALTSLLFLIWQPIGSAAISRMPNAVASLAAWQVLTGLIFMVRSFGYSYNEVVVALLDEPGSYPALKRFTYLLAGSTTLLHLLIAATPLSMLWFRVLSALPANLAELAHGGFWIAVLMPALTTFQSWFQGAIVTSKKTRAIPESTVVYLLVVFVVLGAGVAWGQVTGLYVGVLAFILATFGQTVRLGLGSRRILARVRVRDEEAAVYIESSTM